MSHHATDAKGRIEELLPLLPHTFDIETRQSRAFARPLKAAPTWDGLASVRPFMVVEAIGNDLALVTAIVIEDAPEMPVTCWHVAVSIARWATDTHVIPNTTQRLIMEDICTVLLDGVGTLPQSWATGQTGVVHCHRMLSRSEVLALRAETN